MIWTVQIEKGASGNIDFHCTFFYLEFVRAKNTEMCWRVNG